MRITSVKGFWILDSRANPTIMTIVKTKDNMGVASVPSGASTGKHEAYELRDGKKAFNGMGVDKAIQNVGIIAKKIIGLDVAEQEKIDYTMKDLDNTPNKSKLGANAILSVSLAAARCAAAEKHKELYDYLGDFKGFPTPLFNVINGGKHAGSNLAIQECLIIPDTNNFEEDVRIGCEVYHELKNVILKKFGKFAVNVGDEGGFAPPLNDIEDAFRLITRAVESLGYEKKVGLGIDAAASEFYTKGRYVIGKKKFDADKLTDYYKHLVSRYPLWSIEDPFEEDDFDSFAKLNSELRYKTQIVGDDLLATNIERIKTAVQKKSCNALILKVNQVGTLTEAKKACVTAHKNNMNVIVSHRSGETCDDFISDLCLGWACEELKAGAPARGERVSKYNRLLMLEQLMKAK